MSVFKDYFATLTSEESAALNRIYDLVVKYVPGTEEGTSYGMPALKYKGKAVASFMATKHHLSYYPHSGKVVSALTPKLAPGSFSSGTIKFSIEEPLPEAIIQEAVRLRQAEIDKIS